MKPFLRPGVTPTYAGMEAASFGFTIEPKSAESAPGQGSCCTTRRLPDQRPGMERAWRGTPVEVSADAGKSWG
jgi:hypothetical protein